MVGMKECGIGFGATGCALYSCGLPEGHEGAHASYRYSPPTELCCGCDRDFMQGWRFAGGGLWCAECADESPAALCGDTADEASSLQGTRPVAPHYTSGGIEFIDYQRSTMPTAEFVAACVFNTSKYLHRYRHKGDPKRDLGKARDYLTFALEALEDVVTPGTSAARRQ